MNPQGTVGDSRGLGVSELSLAYDRYIKLFLFYKSGVSVSRA